MRPTAMEKVHSALVELYSEILADETSDDPLQMQAIGSDVQTQGT